MSAPFARVGVTPLNWFAPKTSANYDAGETTSARVRGGDAPEPMAPVPGLRRLEAAACSPSPTCCARPRIWRWESPRAAPPPVPMNDNRFCRLRPRAAVDRPERQLGVSSGLIKRRPFAAARLGRRRRRRRRTGAMGDFGEGPLGTKLGQGATASTRPRPPRVKNKTPSLPRRYVPAPPRGAVASSLRRRSHLPRLERVPPPAMIDAR